METNEIEALNVMINFLKMYGITHLINKFFMQFRYLKMELFMVDNFQKISASSILLHT